MKMADGLASVVDFWWIANRMAHPLNLLRKTISTINPSEIIGDEMPTPIDNTGPQILEMNVGIEVTNVYKNVAKWPFVFFFGRFSLSIQYKSRLWHAIKLDKTYG